MESSNVQNAVASPGVLKLWPWVNQVCGRLASVYASFTHNANQTPLTVSSKLPLEVVMQLFKRMGYVRHVLLHQKKYSLTAAASAHV